MTTAVILLLTVVALPVAALLSYVALSSRHRKASLIPLAPVGRVGTVERELSPEGFVLVGGELWPARVRGECPGRVGAGVRVVGASGCSLEVEPLD